MPRQEQRKSSHQPYGKISEVLDTDMDFCDFFSHRQMEKVRTSVDEEIKIHEAEDASGTYKNTWSVNPLPQPPEDA